MEEGLAGLAHGVGPVEGSIARISTAAGRPSGSVTTFKQ